MSHRSTPRALVAAILSLCALTAGASPRPQVELSCVTYGMGPQLECTVRAKGGGAALDGVQVTLGATMPSMPMTHRVKSVPAAPTGRPGEYRGTLPLEMNGVWTVQVDLAGPMRDRVARTLAVEPCEGARRCPVAAVRPAGPSIHKH